MNKVSVCTKERKKQLTVDLLIIGVVTFIVLSAVVVGWGNGMTEFADDRLVNIAIRVLIVGIGGQFGIAGLGITIVCLFRKGELRKRAFSHTFYRPTAGIQKKRTITKALSQDSKGAMA